MNPNDRDQGTEQAWQETLAFASPPTRVQVAATMERLAARFADDFYAHMLADERASKLLDIAMVKARQHAMLTGWLIELFAADTTATQSIAVQQKVGEVHARIGVPIDLVTHGARTLKRSIAAQLAREIDSPDRLVQAIQYVYELMDLAIDAMTAAYSANANRMLRSDEAYRLHFLNQNMRAERERQKGQLLEWAQQILVRYYWEDQTDSAAVQGEGGPSTGQGFRQSQFGLWLHHKASILFDGAPEIADMDATITEIEEALLPRLARARASHVDARAVVSEINLRIDRIKALLGSMFDRFIEAEDGRDTVTRLLNRRYFPSVAKREIALAQETRGVFALLMVDIDRFQRLRESLGADASDRLLSDVAEGLLDSVRAGDFVFRVGDDRFVVLLVEAPAGAAGSVAEGLRRRVESMSPRTIDQVATVVTVSLGIAVFDGHPDYQHLLDRAEVALMKAKSAGGNRCQQAD